MTILDWHHLGPAPKTLVAILLVLIVASITARILRWRKPGKSQDELVSRVRSWWVMIGILAAALALGRTASVVFLALVSYLALKEFLSFVPMRWADRRILFVAFLAVPIQFYWIGIGWYGGFIVFVPVYMFLALPALMVLDGETKGFIKAAGTLHWGLMVCVFAIGHAAYLLVLPVPGAPPGGLLIYLLLLTEGNDVAQFIAGKLFGKRKVVPKVSPNKTWGGLLGGIVVTTLMGMALARFLTGLDPTAGLALGAMIAVAGFLGDVTLSAVKRDLGIKDMGRLIPGHGGVLDRVDSLVFAAPLFFHTVRYFWT